MYRKKLCLVMPDLETGGMERVMSELAGNFCKIGNLEVHLVLYGRTSNIFYSVPESLIIHKPNTIFIEKLRLVYSFGRMIFLRRIVKKIKPDSILSFGEYWNSFVILSLLGLKYHVYISDRCSPEKSFSLFHTFLRRWLYPRAKGVIAQTEEAKKLYVNQFKNHNICVIGNPIKQVISNFSLKRENIVLSVGRLIDSKHHDKLIEVFARISQSDWKLMIVGGDSIKQFNMSKLKVLIHTLHMDEKILLEGDQLDVDSYYLRCKIFAFTSSSEGFPNAIGEALSSGLPVIAFDCVTGPSELIQNGINGILIPLFNYKAFEEELKKLMIDEILREKLSSNASSSVARFSSENISMEYLKFILK